MHFVLKHCLVFFFTLLSIQLICQIEYTDRVPDDKINASQNVTVDLDKNGIIDFEFRLTLIKEEGAHRYIFDVININATEVAVNDGSASVIQYGESIDENLLWDPSNVVNMLNFYQFHEESGNWLNIQTGFLGLRMKVGDQYIYGWLRILAEPNFDMWVVDYACEMDINNPIVAGQGIPPGATSLVGKDVNDYFDGRDINVSFIRAFNETNFKEYRIILAKAKDTTALDLNEMNQVGENRYYSVLINTLEDSPTVSLNLLANTIDKEGDPVNVFVKYKIHLLNVATNGDPSDNILSSPSPEFFLQSYTQAATEIVAWDIGNNNSADDVNFTFIRAEKEWDINEYRVFIGEIEEIPNFNIQTALSLNENYYTNITPDTTNVISSLHVNQLDINGNSIKEGNFYQAIVLTAADSINSNSSSLSLPSRQFSLTNPNNLVAGLETGNQLVIYGCDSLFSDYNIWEDDTDSIYIDMNRDGLADFRLTGLDRGSPMFHETEFYIYPERNNKILCCSHDDHDNWIDVLIKYETIAQEFKWLNDKVIFIDYYVFYMEGESEHWRYGHGGSAEIYHGKSFYIGFCIMDNPDKPQYGWLYIKGMKFTNYAFQDFENSFEESKTSYEFTIYPNPAQHKIVIKKPENIPPGSELQITIYNQNGRIYDEFSFIGSTYSLEVLNYEKGLYFIVATTEGKQKQVIKFIVN